MSEGVIVNLNSVCFFPPQTSASPISSTQAAYEELESSAQKKSKMEEQLRTSLETQLLRALTQKQVGPAFCVSV